jgi:DNA-binding FadR family transcriptional regulator
MSQLVDTSSIARRVAAVLRAIIFGKAPDSPLGSEEELTRSLGVSSTMLRQAARILEHEQLLVIKRGPAGGYFTRRPTAEAAVHVAAVYLRSHGASQLDALDVSMALCRLTVGKAVQCTDGNLRAELRAVMESRSNEAPTSESAIFPLLARMTGNLVVELVMATFVDYSTMLDHRGGAAVSDAAAREERHRIRTQLAQAVLDKREEEAVEWMTELMQVYRSHITAQGVAS